MPAVSVALTVTLAGVFVGVLYSASVWPGMRTKWFFATCLLLGAFLVWVSPSGASNPWVGPLFFAICLIAYAFGSAVLLSGHPAMRNLSLPRRASLVLTQSRILRQSRSGQ